VKHRELIRRSPKSAVKRYRNIVRPINQIATEINSTLDKRKTEEYFEGVILLYSFIENLLKWLVCVELLWKGASSLPRKLDFYDAQCKALTLKLITQTQFKRIDSIRKERNNVVHQFWLWRHRGNRSVLRRKLEKLARIANDLVGVFNTLTRKVGVDEVYGFFPY